MISTNSIQTFKLIYSYNVVQESIAYIFVNSHCDGLVYKDASKKGIDASKIFSEVLKYTEVSTFTNLTKENIIEKLKHLKARADKFTESS